MLAPRSPRLVPDSPAGEGQRRPLPAERRSTPLPSFPVTPRLPHRFKAPSVRKAMALPSKCSQSPTLSWYLHGSHHHPGPHHLSPGLLRSPVAWPPSVANCHATASVAFSPCALLTRPAWLPRTRPKAASQPRGPSDLALAHLPVLPHPLLLPHPAPCQTTNIPSTHHFRAFAHAVPPTRNTVRFSSRPAPSPPSGLCPNVTSSARPSRPPPLSAAPFFGPKLHDMLLCPLSPPGP